MKKKSFGGRRPAGGMSEEMKKRNEIDVLSFAVKHYKKVRPEEEKQIRQRGDWQRRRVFVSSHWAFCMVW